MGKHIQYIRTQHFPPRIQYTLHPDTISEQVGHTNRKSTQNTESTVGLATASNLQRLGFERCTEKNNLKSTKMVTTTRLGFLVSFCSQILKEGQILNFDPCNRMKVMQPIFT